MDSYFEDQLLDSWEQAYEDGDNPGSIMGFNDLLAAVDGVYQVSTPQKANNHTKKRKRKKPTKKELLDQQIIDQLGNVSSNAEPRVSIISTPTGKQKDPILKMFDKSEEKQEMDDWFLEWLGIEVIKKRQDDFFLDWLGVPKETT